MQAEIISIGSELLLGHTINSDAALVARVLAELGIGLRQVQTVGDNRERLESALRQAANRCDLIITTGGLGPTDDDLTKSAVADFVGAPLVEFPEAARMLREYFGEREMSPNQARQAYLPEGATMFPNNAGTAPGCAVAFGEGKRVIMLPGPPRELEAMLRESVIPYLSGKARSVIHSSLIRTFGIGEGKAAHMIRDLMEGANPTVAPYAKSGEMFIRVTARAEDAQAAAELAAPTIAEIRRRLGDVIYGIDVESIEAKVVSLLTAAKKTVATAESCTGGLLAKRITDRPGASAVFQLGLVTYSNKAKEDALEVPGEILARYGAVSPQVAEIMAANVRTLGRADYGVGITGIAGPDGGTPEKPVGLVYIALAAPKRAWLREMRLKGRYPGRDWVRERASSIALDMLRRELEGLPVIIEEN